MTVSLALAAASASSRKAPRQGEKRSDDTGGVGGSKTSLNRLANGSHTTTLES
jgi:hypothetical protein